MSTPRRPVRVLAGLGLSLGLVATQALSSTTAAASDTAASGHPNVRVVDLRVDDRSAPMGIDDARPLLGWQLSETHRAAGHPCHRPGSRRACPGDEQTAYQIQAATSGRDLAKGRLVWDSGKVRSATQTGVPYAGSPLGSREKVVWHVRVWDADGRSSDWSSPSSWEMGLLEQSDWGRPAGSSTRDAPRASPCRSSRGSSGSRAARTCGAPGSTCPVSACSCRP